MRIDAMEWEIVEEEFRLRDEGLETGLVMIGGLLLDFELELELQQRLVPAVRSWDNVSSMDERTRQDLGPSLLVALEL